MIRYKTDGVGMQKKLDHASGIELRGAPATRVLDGDVRKIPNGHVGILSLSVPNNA